VPSRSAMRLRATYLKLNGDMGGRRNQDAPTRLGANQVAGDGEAADLRDAARRKRMKLDHARQVGGEENVR
jgi:hypothetical protein